MAPIAGFLHYIVDGLLGLLIIVLIATAVLSWLVAFDVVNLRNPTMRRIYYGLQGFIEPMLRPIRRFVPPLGGVDLSFLVLFLIVQGARMFLVAPLFNALASLG
ncbi:MAG: YggT family protein [Pseudomonadota bacterium]